MTTAGIIPARGGSKRVRCKNITPLLDRPLMAWTCDAAKAARLDAVYVSTEDADVREVARREGVYVIDRPEDLASDTASTDGVLLHASEVLGLGGDDVIVCLQPTSPLRTGEHINEALALLTPGINSVVSAKPMPVSAVCAWRQDGGEWAPLYDPRRRIRSQDVRSWAENGAIYAARVIAMRAVGVRCPAATVVYPMNEIDSIDIDTYSDLDTAGYWLTRMLMRRRSEHAEAAGWRR